MSDASEINKPSTGGEKASWWRRLFGVVLPDRVIHRWDRLPESSQQDAVHYNVRSGL